MHPAHRVATRRRGAAQPLRLMRRAGVAVALVLALVTVPARASIAARGKHAPQPASKDSAPNAPGDARELGSLQSSARVVSVGLYVLNLGSIDLSNGAFDADFYLYLTAEAGSGGRYDVASDYESYLPNAGSNPRVWVVSKLKSRTNLTSQYRMKGKFYFEPDVSVYPFDKFALPVHFEDPHEELDSLQFVVDNKYNSLSSNIAMPGFSRAASANFRASVTNTTYPGGKTFSRFTGTVYIARPKLNAALKAFLPAVIVLLVVALNSSIPSRHATARASVAGSSLVALVLFHSNLLAQVPSTGQVTLADSFMAMCYVLIVQAFVVCLLLLRSAEAGADALEAEVHVCGQLAQWVLTPMAVLAVVYSGLTGAMLAYLFGAVAIAARRYTLLRARGSPVLAGLGSSKGAGRARRFDGSGGGAGAGGSDGSSFRLFGMSPIAAESELTALAPEAERAQPFMHAS